MNGRVQWVASASGAGAVARMASASIMVVPREFIISELAISRSGQYQNPNCLFLVSMVASSDVSYPLLAFMT